MINNSIFEIIKTLSRKEMTRFREFSASPYHNKHGDVRGLVDFLSHLYPNFTAQNCDRSAIFELLFPNQAFQQARLAVVFTYTYRLLEQFLMQEYLNAEEGYQKILLLKHLRERKLFKPYNKVRKRLDIDMADYAFRDSDYYRLQYLAASEADTFYSKQWQRKKDDGIQQKQLNLDYYFLAEKLRDACEMALRSKILKVRYATGLLQPMIDVLADPQQEVHGIPAIHIYYQLYQLITTQEEERYAAILVVLDDYTGYFPVGELQNIFNYLQNYCIEQVNKGSSKFLEASFDLYKRQLDIGLLLDEKGFLSEWHFKNIVAIGLRLGVTDWVYSFIKDHQHELSPEAHHDAYSFNLAAYYYSIQKYDKVLELLLRLELSDIRYHLDSKALLLRTYYDLDELEAFLSLTDSFHQFLQRNKLISDFQRRGYSNLIKFARKIFKIKSELGIHSAAKNSQELQQLSQQMRQTDPVYNLSWLQSKLEALE